MRHVLFRGLLISSISLLARVALADAILPSAKEAAQWRARCAEHLQRALADALRQPDLEGLIIERKDVMVVPGGAVELHLLGAGESGRHGHPRLGVDVRVVLRTHVEPPSGWTRTQGKMAYIPPHIHLERHARLADASVEITQQAMRAGEDLEARFRNAADECLK